MPFILARRPDLPSMKRADEREETPGRVEIDFHFALQALLNEFRALIVNPTARHIDGLNLVLGIVANGLIIAFANHEIIADDAPKRVHRQQESVDWLVSLSSDIEDQFPILHGKMEGVWSFVMFDDLKAVRFNQIKDRDPAFMFGVGSRRCKRLAINFYTDQPMLAHVRSTPYPSLVRMETDRACAGNPSASASVRAAPESTANPEGPAF